MPNRVIEAAGVVAAAGGYSPAVLADGQRWLFLSGQVPTDLEADIRTQIRQTFEQIHALLGAAGATFQDVVMIRAYFLQLERHLAVFREVRQEFLQPPYPAATVVGVSALAIPGLQVEIEAVAVVG
ncbi:MAG: hypothetical protein CMJ59_14455 [Planctomycetaceae bacterium]|nr:hypothetical protein [Planctomycetaceae bacterium]